MVAHTFFRFRAVTVLWDSHVAVIFGILLVVISISSESGIESFDSSESTSELWAESIVENCQTLLCTH
jgi:hypothetical protein